MRAPRVHDAVDWRGTAMPAEVEAALTWLAKAFVPIAALQEASMVSQALDRSRKLDGSAVAPEYLRSANAIPGYSVR